jgi:NitT/TauT family transport system permease protein
MTLEAPFAFVRADREEVARRLQAAASRVTVPLLAVAALVGLWELVIWAFDVKSYVVPSPPEVWSEFRTEHHLLISNLWPTAYETLLGFTLGNASAILLAIVFVHSRPVERALFPAAVFVRTIPIVAIAPVLVIIFGTGYTPKILIAALISFFPTLVNMVRGFQSVTPENLELFRVLSANRWEVFFKLRVFASLPYLFSALKIAATSAVIGAIVGEWVGSQRGLGYLIIQSTYNFRTSELYATMIVAALFATAFFAAVGVAERLIVRWDAKEQP